MLLLFSDIQSWCSFVTQVQQMEAVLRDYSNSFNSLQSVSQGWHPIIVLCPLLREEGGWRGEERSSVQLTAPPSGPESHELCAAAADRIPALTIWIAEDGDCGRCCGCRGSAALWETHLRYPFSLPCWLHGGIYTLQLGASPIKASIAVVLVCFWLRVVSRWTL